MRSDLRPEAIDLDDDSGIDRKQLKRLKQRFLELNQKRHQRMLAGLSERQQALVSLLPLLFHVNHPMLPGYISHRVPSGLSHYQPDKIELRAARTLARSFHYQRDPRAPSPNLDALFVMGSIGTIAQSDTSDLDVWLCHTPGLNPEGRELLGRKCRELTRWAKEAVHLEVHFFLMEAGPFRTGELGAMSAEGSGTAQRFLLLDEFYRTALWLGGKLPLWWFVPASREGDYRAYADTLLHRRFVRADEVIDFGGLPAIPPSEFIGAGIWHLYKGIESPHKSVLKLMLLEAYARGEDRSPLALTFKQAMYQAEPDPDALDPYVMVYRRLESYLCEPVAVAHTQTHPHTQGVPQGRLELARRCLYFKVGKALSKAPSGRQKSWQRHLLERLVSEWGWPRDELQRLDNKRQWKAPEVMQERRELVAELSASYRLVSAIQKEETDPRISDDELMILGRKLHAAFERKAGKIEWVNPDISRDLSEPALHFVQEPVQTPVAPRMWAVFRSLSRQPVGEPLKRARHFSELLLWCYGNGVLTAQTWFELESDTQNLGALQRQQLVQLLQSWLPLPMTSLTHEPFQRGARAERLLMLFNLGVEPQQGLRSRGLQMLSNQKDALDFSGLRDNLVLTLDTVQINSWQEVLCRHYDQDALINGLQYYLRLVPPGRGFAPPELTIRCLGEQGNVVVQRLEELWRDLVGCYYSGTRPPSSRYVLEMAGSYVLIQFLQQQPQVTRFANYDALIDKLSHLQLEYSPIVVDRHALRNKPLRLIAEQAERPGVYVFYQVLGKEAEVTLVDELGSILVTRTPFYSDATLLRPLHYFLQAVLERLSASSEQSAGLTPGKITLYELCGRIDLGRGYFQQRSGAFDLRSDEGENRRTGEANGGSFINIQVIAEPDDEGRISFCIYCNDQEFSQLDMGSALFKEVAAYILAQRQSQERYPCYITDLDLSLCRDLLAPQLGLRLSHYLDLKAQLELGLNTALQEL